MMTEDFKKYVFKPLYMPVATNEDYNLAKSAIGFKIEGDTEEREKPVLTFSIMKTKVVRNYFLADDEYPNSHFINANYYSEKTPPIPWKLLYGHSVDFFKGIKEAISYTSTVEIVAPETLATKMLPRIAHEIERTEEIEKDYQIAKVQYQNVMADTSVEGSFAIESTIISELELEITFYIDNKTEGLIKNIALTNKNSEKLVTLDEIYQTPQVVLPNSTQQFIFRITIKNN